MFLFLKYRGLNSLQVLSNWNYAWSLANYELAPTCEKVQEQNQQYGDKDNCYEDKWIRYSVWLIIHYFHRETVPTIVIHL